MAGRVVAGADANPYLVIAAILAGVVDGVARNLDRGPTQDPSRTPEKDRALPREWRQAIDNFQHSEFAASQLGSEFRDVYAACRRQEYDKLMQRVTDVEYETYLEQV